MNPSVAAMRTTFIWVMKQVSGVLVFILIGVHLVVNHLVAPNGLLSYNEVIAYLGNPWIAAMEIVFLIVVCSHALLGLRSILLDLNPTPKLIHVMDRLLFVVGFVSVAYGIILTSIIASR